jgi:tryptophan halogenase
MKKAIPFWVDQDKENINPYTSAVAMKNGWIWKIPLQHRIGCGYVFDSDYIDEKQALAEAEEHFGQTLSPRNTINFDAGRYENFWVKNCIAIGLSSSFIEPLESTSIFLSIGGLDTLKQFLNELKHQSDHSVKLYNELVTNSMSDTLDFVYLHYMTKRNDSDFWKNFRKNYPPTERVAKILDLMKNNNLRVYDIEDIKTPTFFSLFSYLSVGYGLGLLDDKIKVDNYTLLDPSIEEYKRTVDQLSLEQFNHKTILNMINQDQAEYKF